MGKIIAVANQKGGVGKTTTAINLAAGLAEREKQVLLVDLDSQSNATSGVGIEKTEVENSTYELISGEASFEDTVVHTAFKNLDALPSSQDLTAAEIELLEEDGREAKLKKVLAPIKDGYDFIIIDCPPSLSMLTVNSLTAADSVLIPIQCEYYALEGLSQLLQTINLVQERINPALKIEGIVFTMYDARVRLSRQVVQNVRENLKEKMFRTLIPRNVRLAEAPSHGQPIMYYTRLCAGTRAYRNLSKEIIAAYDAELAVAPATAEAAPAEERLSDGSSADAAEPEEAAPVEAANEIKAEAAAPAEAANVVEAEAANVAETETIKNEEATVQPKADAAVEDKMRREDENTDAFKKSESAADPNRTDEPEPSADLKESQVPEKAEKKTDRAASGKAEKKTDPAASEKAEKKSAEPEAKPQEKASAVEATDSESQDCGEKEDAGSKDPFASIMERAEKEINGWEDAKK